MRIFVVPSGMLIIYLAAVTALAETNPQPEKRVIPLKDIWAIGMPGTRNLYDLEPDKFGPSIRKLSSAEQLKIQEQSVTTQIHLDYNKPGQSAKPAFAVAGTGAAALREAAAVLSGKKKSEATFPANSNLSVVFFSHLSGYFVHLDKVEQLPGQIVISYRFVPHETKQLTSHFALIPLGKLSPGEVKVDIKRLPLEKKFLNAGFKEPSSSEESQVVAQSFRFTVKGKSD